jgi:hypothetical protein
VNSASASSEQQQDVQPALGRVAVEPPDLVRLLVAQLGGGQPQARQPLGVVFVQKTLRQLVGRLGSLMSM